MTDIEAVPLELEDGTFTVFWESGSAYGARGLRLTEEDAEALAAQINQGEIRP